MYYGDFFKAALLLSTVVMRLSNYRVDIMTQSASEKTKVVTNQSRRRSRAMRVVLFVVFFAMLGYGLWLFKHKEEYIKVNVVVTREAVVQKVQNLNRLETIAFNIDTIITSKKQGTWQALWQDEQKGIFIAHGRVIAGVDFNKLTPEQVTVSEDGKQIIIQLPAVEIFATYLDDIDVYDLQTGMFGLMQVDNALFTKAQEAGKTKVLTTACKANILKLANDNAEKQVQALFNLTGSTVKVNVADLPQCGSM